jgi:tripeptide aminopeptidase
MCPFTQPSAFSRVGQLAAKRRVHEAFQWLHLQEQRIMSWQKDLVEIAAPPFGEAERANWLAGQFRELGLSQVEIDSAGNALGVFPSASPETSHQNQACILLSAHIDTVFPSGTPIDPVLDDRRLSAPGACDNGAGVVALLAIAAALRHAQVEMPCDLLLAGNVGEEGEGDLRGIRHIYGQSQWRERIAANIVLDGAGHEVAVTQGLGSRRFLVTIQGPGGHSWTDAGISNPVVVMSRVIARMADLKLGDTPRTTFNVGTIEGGTSVNAIPEQVAARFDLRSTDSQQLILLEVELHRAVEDAVIAANARQSAPLQFTIETIGDRPAGQLQAGSPILEALRAVDRHLGIRTDTRVASTDANIPLSLGIPAISIGAGGEGGGVHTRAEWYDARGRDLGLRRIFLLVLALAETAASRD